MAPLNIVARAHSVFTIFSSAPCNEVLKTLSVNRNAQNTCHIHGIKQTIENAQVPLSRDSDEDILIKYDDCTCLSWKEILSLVDDYYKVNSFLVDSNAWVYENVT